MREFDQTWTFAADSSGAGAAVEVTGDVTESAWYITNPSASTAGSVEIRSGPTSTGPWVVEGSTSMTSSNSVRVIRLTGPFAWVSPRNVDTSAMTIRAIGVS